MRIYRGWYMVAIALVIYAIIVGATYGSFGLFVHPVSAEFGLSRAEFNTALILLNVGSLFAAPLIGRTLDFSSAKWIMRGCALLFGLSFVALGVSPYVWLDSIVLFLGLSTASLGAGTLTGTVLVARWFAARRGRALVVMAIGLSVGNIFIPPLVGWLMESFGWRTVLVLIGMATTPLLLLLSFFVVERPDAAELIGDEFRLAEAAGAAVRDAGPDVDKPAKAGKILRRVDFWLICMTCAVGTAVAQSLTITLLPLAQERGLAMLQVTSLMSVMGMAAISFKLVLAVFADKIDRVVVLAILLSIEALVNGFLILGDSYAVLVVCAALIGISSAAITPVMQALQADRFGVASFGTVRGLCTPINAVVSAAVLRLSGEIFDRSGSYGAMFFAFLVIQLVATAMILLVRYTNRQASLIGQS